VLGWNPDRPLEDMMSSAWKWEQKLQQDSKLFTASNTKFN
jgi:UDP-glucose 4-epimerase